MNNPAARLHALLIELRGADRSNRPTFKVLAEVLTVEESINAVFRALVTMHELINDVVQTARASGKMPLVVLDKYAAQLSDTLTYANLEAPWHSYREKITPECVTIVEILAHQEGAAQIGEPSADDFNSLTENLQKLFDSVESLKLDPDFRKFVLEQIEGIRQCLANYRISGVQGFQKYLERFIGQVARHSQAMREQSTVNPSLMMSFRAVIAGVAKFVGLTKDGVQLLGSVREVYIDGAKLFNLLPGGGDGDSPEIGSIGGSDT
ncbi:MULTISPECIES: hypothetical protein [Massilia]|jgi:hypothetical protein|uniref:hypothetical protein n=1 Tax=Massilia TaxID=149698 RepID=UPI0016110855|nr:MULTISPECIES: hypothetical protein [Massilia]QYG01672.1 hypothetical protein KY496_25825 [Massilia sp. NP310]